MRDRKASRNYSPERDEFRRVHERQRAWGLDRRYAAKRRRLEATRSAPVGAVEPPTPASSASATGARPGLASSPRQTQRVAAPSRVDRENNPAAATPPPPSASPTVAANTSPTARALKAVSAPTDAAPSTLTNTAFSALANTVPNRPANTDPSAQANATEAADATETLAATDPGAAPEHSTHPIAPPELSAEAESSLLESHRIHQGRPRRAGR